MRSLRLPSLLVLREAAPLKKFTAMPSYPWLVVAIICIGAFVGQLDASIVQLTLPVLEQNFHATLAAVSWVAIGYLLAYAATLPVFARMSEIFGRKLLYVAGYAVFAAASLLCGLATDLPTLIACRLLQGIGGGLLGANSITLLTKAVLPGRRGRAMGFYAASQAIGISAGPVIGGLLLGTLGWKWVFWISVPFAMAGAVFGWLILPQTVQANTPKQFDNWGAMLLSPALAAFIISLSEIGTWRTEAIILSDVCDRNPVTTLHLERARSRDSAYRSGTFSQLPFSRRDHRSECVLRAPLRNVFCDVVQPSYGGLINRRSLLVFIWQRFQS